MDDTDNTSAGLAATEAECAAGRTAPRVSLADIEAAISWETSVNGADVAEYAGEEVAPHSLDVLTLHLMVMRNGFTIVGKSAPASPENFDAALGCKLAREDAIRQAWPLMGFALRDKLASAP